MMEDKVTAINKHCDHLEVTAKCLAGQLDDINAAHCDEELAALCTQNKKLKYRLNILTKSIASHNGGSKDKPATGVISGGSKDKPATGVISGGSSPMPVVPEVSSDHMCAILSHLDQVFQRAVRVAFPDHTAPVNVPIQLSRVADYQCNVAMALAKVLKKTPRVVGQAVLDAAGSSPLIARMELSGPGFINITLSTDFIRQQLTRLVTTGVTPPPTKRRRVAVDFSSPNIAKEMHVGHLRSTIIGESICRLLEFLGHDVMRINHLGDWGTQFGMLIAHLQDRFPDYLKTPPPIGDLQSFYKESKKRFDEDEDFKKRAYQAVVELQSGNEAHTKGWRMICDISMKEFNKVYERLDVQLEACGESFYQSRMVDLVKDLKAKDLLSFEDGRYVMYAEGAGIPLTVVKSDGGFTYDTSDMACIKYRLHELNADWVVYVTDAGQQQHFRSFLACAKRAGIYNPEVARVDHVTFGVVLGEDRKKFKTRSGDTVRLVELLEEGLSRADDVLREKGRHDVLTQQEFSHVKAAVAYGCIKYADLCHDRTRDYVFSFDRMLDFRGNTAAYLLYALTRICSIARTAGISSESLLDDARKAPIELNHEKEWKLARTLLKLPDVLLKLAEELYLHPLCEYLYEVSTVFSEFYDNCYCVEKDSSGTITKIHMNRMLLCEATATVFKQCLAILGIRTVEKM